jgi:hypothetical protein
VQSATPPGRFPLRHLVRQVGAWALGFRLISCPIMMVQIVEHHVETSVDFTVEGEAASSTPQAPSRPAPATTAVHAARQHTVVQTSRTPSRASPGVLSAARELLRHPPSSMASPGAMKQWWDDVDQLLSMAHSTSTRSRARSSRRQHEASASMRSPSVKKKKEEGPRLPEATVHWSGGHSSDQRLGRPQQAPATAEEWQRSMPCAPVWSPQCSGVSRDH